MCLLLLQSSILPVLRSCVAVSYFSLSGKTDYIGKLKWGNVSYTFLNQYFIYHHKLRSIYSLII